MRSRFFYRPQTAMASGRPPEPMGRLIELELRLSHAYRLAARRARRKAEARMLWRFSNDCRTLARRLAAAQLVATGAYYFPERQGLSVRPLRRTALLRLEAALQHSPASGRGAEALLAEMRKVHSRHIAALAEP